jgi:ABC-type Fe3+/spermidine/putrescine transport system ATPase subunit
VEPRVGLIRLERVDFGYGRARVLRGLDLAVPERAITVLVGPSGSGKTSVLRLIAGFEAPARGAIEIGGEVASRDGRVLLPPEARGVGMVFQDLALWPHMTVRQTLEFVLGRDPAGEERRRRIAETLEAVGLDRHAGARPGQLSGGERQRVALARAIVTRPRILLMDEPLSNLDPPLRHALIEEIRRLQQALGLTILYVTHATEETFRLADRAAIMRDGRIEQAGAPRELYERPRSAFVASFLGPCALLPARIRGSRAETALGVLALSDTGSEGDGLVVIRPEDVLVGEEGPFGGRIERAVSLPSAWQAEIAGAGWRLSALLAEEPKPGALVRFAIRRVAAVPPLSP